MYMVYYALCPYTLQGGGMMGWAELECMRVYMCATVVCGGATLGDRPFRGVSMVRAELGVVDACMCVHARACGRACVSCGR